MRIGISSTLTFTAATLLAGCSGQSGTTPASQVPPASFSAVQARNAALPQSVPFALPRPHAGARGIAFPPRARPNDGTVYLAECGYYASDCNLYSAGSVVSTLSGSGIVYPQGVISDAASGNLFVADMGTSSALVYSTSGGIFTQVSAIADPGEYPIDVATTERGKKKIACVAISNIFTTQRGSGSVSVACGKKLKTLTASTAFEGIGIATDGKSNCYWSYNALSGGGSIVEFKSCGGKARPVLSGLGFAGGLAFDSENDLWYADQIAATIYECKGTKECVAAFSGFSDPLFINFSADFTTLYVADAGNGDIDACAVGGACSIYATRPGSDPPFGVAPIPGVY